MGYKDIINNLKPIEYSKYKDITSYEKLMIYVAKVLEDKNVPLTFNYLCISAFKIFPDAFCCDEEFKEFPSVDRLNRTMMHLKYVKNAKPYIAGSVKTGYEITNIGKSVALQVENIINNTKEDKSIEAPKVDKHKKGFSKDYVSFIEGEGYKKYLKTNKIDIMYVWEFFKVIPYTQIKSTKENLKHVMEYAKENKDEKCMKFIDGVLKLI